MNSLRRVIFEYLGIFLLFTSIYLCLFHTPLLISQRVMFYRGLGLLFIATFLTLILLLTFRNKSKLNFETLVTSIVMSFSINIVFFVVFPVTFERSVTMYVLNKLNTSKQTQNCQGLSKSDLEKDFIENYVIKNQAMQKRINEQKIINMINEENNCISISSRGRSFLDFSRIVERIYSP
ncbi:hypothetical protein AUK04_05015 [Candidatus Roizmanbacteria bacterium CG2_30_33_16]|uniref:Uncharacterized protein n=4 Tax=Candidatus Roizmaniibacteriota TaxID=1752723 RepID=A0A2M7E564_9BACT|nr:hypothetical protein [Candidatus Roizmanbacteria bacterium]OIP82257.1 MAG: hypothetical protein AUK04_05015 [Candidatus Roizmanbacteria bacterium CG2_30_33_16]PIP64218.1 MAG: hypothetical protein COW96_03790 [Candidatus Roizmanbacteria bacterium CG22_combo_CG10-13_8_21_14_all_33_16]PIV62864.1 MAG: hypothetical protein COS12_00770 [Candidatus Roizmanbacteria bacterium CG01_land_8_20_14_3_00_33_9]PJB87686.1 MAG: hypothetical protein CO083_05700 [Candidatus Roizmanbacteria bacterium CG_4_9_14_0